MPVDESKLAKAPTLNEKLLAHLPAGQQEVLRQWTKKALGWQEKLKGAESALAASGNMLVGALESAGGGTVTATVEAFIGENIGKVQTTEAMAIANYLAAAATYKQPVAHNLFRTWGEGNVFAAARDRWKPMAKKLAAKVFGGGSNSSSSSGTTGGSTGTAT